MRQFFAVVLVTALLILGCVSSAAAQAKAPATKAGDAKLDSVLTQMDTAAANFRSAEADFVWDQYQKVIDETESQKGKVYFRRNNKDTQMAAHIVSPDQKQVVYSDGVVQLYQPKIDQITKHTAANNRAEIESFLVLGFGGKGHELLTTYEVRYGGTEMVDGVETHKLELTPKTPKVRNMFEKIVLWIDSARDVSIKQQLFEPTGDYRLAHYSNIKVNQKINDDVFKIKTTKNTKIVTPQG